MEIGRICATARRRAGAGTGGWGWGSDCGSSSGQGELVLSWGEFGPSRTKSISSGTTADLKKRVNYQRNVRKRHEKNSYLWLLDVYLNYLYLFDTYLSLFDHYLSSAVDLVDVFVIYLNIYLTYLSLFDLFGFIWYLFDIYLMIIWIICNYSNSRIG